MPKDEKSIDIRLYSMSKVQAAFDEAVAADEQPAADVIAAMRDRIQDHLNAGKSISWVISVLQRGGLDLGARQLRTYLQRAGIGGDAGRAARRSSGQRAQRKPKGADGTVLREAGVKASPADGGSQAGGTRAENVQSSCSEREASRASGGKQLGNGFGDVPAENVTPVPAEDMQAVHPEDVQPVPAGHVQDETAGVRSEDIGEVQSGNGRPVLAFGQSTAPDDGAYDLV